MVNKPKKVVSDHRKVRITKVLPVECRVVELPSVQTGSSHLSQGQTFGGRTINVSEDGLLVNSDYYMDPKTKLEVVLNFTVGGSKKTIRILAVVARSRRNAFNLYGRWGLGLHILEIDPKEFNLLSSFFIDSTQN